MPDRIPSDKNPFNPPQEILDRDLLYRAIISSIRDADQKDGRQFLQRYLQRPEEWRKIILKKVAAVWDVWDPVTCPADLLIYLKDIVGWDSEFDYLTQGLSEADLRKLIALGIPLWKERFSEVGIRNVIRLLTGKYIGIVNWFDWRAIVGETLLTEEQVGYDFWVIGGLVSRFDEYYSQIRVMDDGTLDRQLILDLVGIERVSSERIEVGIVDFLDHFEGVRDLWETKDGTPAQITSGLAFSIPSGTNEEGLSGDRADYVLISKFKLDSDASFLSHFYVEDWDNETFYQWKISKNFAELTRFVSGTPVVLDTPILSFPIMEDLWYKFRISCVEEGGSGDKRIKTYVDGNLISSVLDASASPVSGDFVLGSGASLSYPSDLIILAHFNDTTPSFDLDYARDSGSLTGTTSGSPAIVSGGKFNNCLELGPAHEHVLYSGPNLIDAMVLTGCVSFWIRPGYSGAPSVNQIFYASSNASGNSNNLVQFWHKSDGLLRFLVSNSIGATIVDISAVWTPIAGTWYHIEGNLNVDVAGSPASRLFLNGSQHGSTDNSSGARTGASQYLVVGDTAVGTGNNNNFRIDEVQAYDTVQHTANFTPPTSEIVLTGGGNVEVDNVELFRVPLRLAEIGPSGVTISPNFFTP